MVIKIVCFHSPGDLPKVVSSGTNPTYLKSTLFIALAALTAFFDVNGGIFEPMFVVYVIHPAPDVEFTILRMTLVKPPWPVKNKKNRKCNIVANIACLALNIKACR